MSYQKTLLMPLIALFLLTGFVYGCSQNDSDTPPSQTTNADDTGPTDTGPTDTGPTDTASDEMPGVIYVTNRCPFPIWSHVIGFERQGSAPIAIDNGQARKVDTGETLQYTNLPQFGGGRVYAYYKEPPAETSMAAPLSPYNQFVEMTFDLHATNYNISYVDYAALPVSVYSAEGCGEAVSAVPYEDWQQQFGLCPTEIVSAYNGIGKCLGSYNYCIQDKNRETDYCKKMEVYGYSATEIYGGYFPDHPAQESQFWDQVAAWNRGTFAGDTDPNNYYQEPQQVNGVWEKPYNEYAKWIHVDLGTDVYAFSTDDHQNHGGFYSCLDSNELYVDWCPLD